jgi:hypothetical protein
MHRYKHNPHQQVLAQAPDQLFPPLAHPPLPIHILQINQQGPCKKCIMRQILERVIYHLPGNPLLIALKHIPIYKRIVRLLVEGVCAEPMAQDASFEEKRSSSCGLA